MLMATKVLTRSERNRVLSGVFGGLGEYLNVDPNLLRLVGAVLLIIAPVAMVLLYVLAVLLIPRQGGVSYISPTFDVSKVGPLLVGFVFFAVGLALMGGLTLSILRWPFTGLFSALTWVAGLVIAVLGLVLMVGWLRRL